MKIELLKQLADKAIKNLYSDEEPLEFSNLRDGLNAFDLAYYLFIYYIAKEIKPKLAVEILGAQCLTLTFSTQENYDNFRGTTQSSQTGFC